MPYKRTKYRRTITRSGKSYPGNVTIGQMPATVTKHQLLKMAGAQSTSTDNKRKYVSRNYSGNGPRAPFKHKRKRVINSKLNGITKKFVKKVKKAVAYTGVWGIYKYIGNVRLSQVTIDQYSVQDEDELSHKMTLGDLKTVQDAYAITWNSKEMKSDYTLTLNNFSNPVPFTILYQNIEFFFKSTSGHVVNVELYECTYKKTCSVNAKELATDSYNDYRGYFKRHPDTSAAAVINESALGQDASMWTTLQNYCHVKKHTIKVQPGGYSSILVKGASNKTYDPSKLQNESDVLPTFIKGSKSFFFRTLNDVTVADAGTPFADRGQIHAFPSNNRGGVACRYTRTIKCAPPSGAQAGTAAYQNSVFLGNWYQATSDALDQQVAMQNPVQLAKPTS